MSAPSAANLKAKFEAISRRPRDIFPELADEIAALCKRLACIEDSNVAAVLAVAKAGIDEIERRMPELIAARKQQFLKERMERLVQHEPQERPTLH
jgi:hypothetical protein